MTQEIQDTPHILIVDAPYYADICEELLNGATEVLRQAGATSERVSVPGALEIPAAVAYAIRSLDVYAARRRFDGFVALGCIIRGETTHYESVANETNRGLQDLVLRHCLALGNGVLTVENGAQAWERARTDRKNKGGGAAQACLDMLETKRHFHLWPR